MSLFSSSIFSNEINIWPTSTQKNLIPLKKETLEIIKDFVCYHQGKFIQYVFLAGEYHKEMKKAFKKNEQDRDEIETRYNELVDYLNKNLAEVSAQSFEKIKRYFQERNEILPRICTKANFNSEASTNNKKIVELFRDHSVGYISNCEIDKNTGFKEIKDTGLSYYCQNIPEAVKKNKYTNPRINLAAAKFYSEPIQKRSFFKKTKKDVNYDEKWVECWQNYDEDKQSIAVNYRDCYKSTLIIPLTLRNNILNNRFLSKFRLPDIDRTIFGYLCFDHIETNYFKINYDHSIGYVFADILSLYLLIRHMYVTQSRTYQDVEKYLVCGGN